MNIKVIRNMKEIILTTCCSFTIIVMGNALLVGADYAMTIGNAEIRKVFIICFITSLIIDLALKISFQKEWMNLLNGYIVMNLCVFGLGTYIFHLIPWNVTVYLSVSLMCALAYLCCMSLIMIVQKNDADKINQKLAARVQKQEERKPHE